VVVDNNIDDVAYTGGSADYVGDAQRALGPMLLARSALRSIPAHTVTGAKKFLKEQKETSR